MDWVTAFVIVVWLIVLAWLLVLGFQAARARRRDSRAGLAQARGKDGTQ